ncbi:MAG: HAMP domain-containing sensor histidine kinase [Candidatus Hatepunaea meridiana]|nr:HAMP domain-containing sensor histidine kinase [Candidatus Hatepunaea meridiana]
MFRFFKYFRFTLVLTAMIGLVVLQSGNTFVINILREGLYAERAVGIASHEGFINNLVRRKLSEPISSVSAEIKQFVKQDMDKSGFIRYLKRDACNPLISAGFIWHRDVDSLIVIPVASDIDPVTRQRLCNYLDAAKTERFYVLTRPSPGSHFDSLDTKIRETSGFSLYYYNYNREFRLAKEWGEARKVIFGIVWNHEYYREEVLPELKQQIIADPYQYGLAKFMIEKMIKQDRQNEEDTLKTYSDINWKESNLKNETFVTIDYYNGILLTTVNGDTILSLGKVEISRKTSDKTLFTPWLVSKWIKSPFRKIHWSPGWKLSVQDHCSSSKFGRSVSWLALTEISDEPIFMNTFNLLPAASRMGRFLTMQWILLSIVSIVLFLVILVQIIARNRQRDFIAHISHELRTPVTNIKLFSETLLNDRTVSEDKENEYLDTILRESDHLTVLIDNTLNLARLEEGKMKIKPISQNLSDWLQDFYNQNVEPLKTVGFETILKVEPNLPEVRFDRGGLELALRNIVDNAVKYTEKSKEIEINLKTEDDAKLQIKVKDRGIGVPSTKRKTIFRKFYRVKSKDREPIGGAGLGLSIVKEIIRAHRGKVWCKRREGGGSVFVIELPNPDKSKLEKKQGYTG